MKNYELTVLFHPDLEMNLEPATNKIKKIIEDSGGKILHESNDGKKRLAYKIAEQQFAIYYAYDVELPPTAPAKISNGLSLADEVIRDLLVSVDTRKAKMLTKQKEQEGGKAEKKAVAQTEVKEAKEAKETKAVKEEK